MRALAFVLIASVATAQDKKADNKKPPRIAINDPAKLQSEPDYLYTGEFVGEASVNDSTFKMGIQISALGNAKYALRAYHGGLPGDGWDGNWEKSPMTGSRTDNVIRATHKGTDHELQFDSTAKTLTSKITSDKPFRRIERLSPTLDAKPPEGAIVLYGGPEDIRLWSGTKVVELSDGKFLGVGGRTKQKFQSFTLHLEFRLPWMPNSGGQARANSGVYLQDRYEIQVLDSFGLKGENNECGGFYQLAAPKVNMCFPPMTWQTYDVDFTAAQFDGEKKIRNAIVTVKHNGVVIHDKIELPKVTLGSGITKETPEPGPLYLQDHNDPVVYRNIWIVEKK